MSEAGSQRRPDDALIDLLVKQVTEGLSPAEQRVLEDAGSADRPEAEAFSRDLECAAAAICLSAVPGSALPAELHARLEQQAAAYAAGVRTSLAARSGETAAVAVAAPGTVVDIAAARTAAAGSGTAGSGAAAAQTQRTGRGATLGWLAAAACLLLAIFGWFRPSPAPLSLVQARAALLARPDALKVTLGATKDPAAQGVTGDVVWDPATQSGFLRFVGLAPNDPRVQQYQIWIFDGSRDQRYPVDGGVFNVQANAAEVVIPIHAALAIRKPAAFAVTVEKPGGVVVSSRDRVVVLGAAG